MQWWKDAVVYQIYPRSFQDSPRSPGVGDLDGIRRRLRHVATLGADAIWLSPFYRSPMADFGYDVADYCDVDPMFGTLGDLDALVADAHALGLRVLIDFVPNHTSDRHPWFVDARSSRDAAQRDWYVWRDEPPNDWKAAWGGGPAWTRDDRTGQWYLHLFLPEQPDLDWTNPAVVEAMHGVVRFWLDRGVDGFRIDVVHLIGKEITSDPPAPSALTHELLRQIRRVVDSYPERVTVGEVYIMSTARVAEFYGDGDELHLSFNFPPLWAPWDAAIWRKRIDRVIEEFDPRGAWPTWVLSNHDVVRHRTRYGSEAKARAACLLLLGLRGTPFLYAGEELGLGDAAIPEDRVVDPGGRDGCRAPIPWDRDPTHGWGTEDPWLPWPPGVDATTQDGDPTSMLNLYRRALSVRRSSPALRHGTFRWLDSPDGVLAWERASGGDLVQVAVNMTDELVELPVRGEVVAGDPTGPSAAVWVRPVDGR